VSLKRLALNNGGIIDRPLDDALIITEHIIDVAVIPRCADIQIPGGGRIKNCAATVPKPSILLQVAAYLGFYV
jgi:hypothetical protein